MSYILDALKKAAEQRDVHAPAIRRLFSPTPEIVDSPRWRMALTGGAAALGGAALVAAMWMLWPSTPMIVAERPETVPTMPRVQPETPPVVQPPAPPAPPIVRTTPAPAASAPPAAQKKPSPRPAEARPPTPAQPSSPMPPVIASLRPLPAPVTPPAVVSPPPAVPSPPPVAAPPPSVVPPPAAVTPPLAVAAVPPAAAPPPVVTPPARAVTPVPAAPPPRVERNSPLRIEVIVYSDERPRRLAFINGRKYVEGDTLADGSKIQEIQPDAVVIVDDGRRVVLRP